MRTFTYVVVVLMTTAAQVKAQNNYVCDDTPGAVQVTEDCLGCICEASTDCDRKVRCVGGGSFCGPFLLSKPFWSDAGSCTASTRIGSSDSDFRRCATDLSCAGKTIRSYIKRFEKDCNGDQLITCDDFAMLHKNGGWSCGVDISGSDFWRKYEACKAHLATHGRFL